MENTRILINQDDKIIKQLDQVYEAEKSLILNKVNNVIIRFTEFDDSDGGMTTAKYEALITDGPQSNIDTAIGKIKQEFSTAGISSPAIIDIAIERTSEKGNLLSTAFNELQQYLNIKAEYPEMKFTLTDIKVVDGLAVIKNEKNLEDLKDTKARKYIDAQIGYDLVAKAENLAATLNSINDILRTNGIYNITDLQDFSNFVDYAFPSKGSNARLEVNLQGVFNYASRIKSNQQA